jgi:Ca2+-transporting ATPase
VAIAVAALPTGLPTVVTTLLSLGTQELAKENAILKDISSVETLGSTSAINSDKTGTLTLNQMTAREMLFAGNRYRITGSGYSSEGHLERTGDREAPLESALLAMSLSSDASVRDGELVGDPTEGALVTLASKGGLDVDGERSQHPRIALVPFDSAYKLMASFHEATDANGVPLVRCFVKGAPTALLDRASSVSFLDGDPMPIEQARSPVMDANARMAERGMRVLLVGVRDFAPDEIDLSADDLLPAVEGIDVLALVAIVDPPRPEAKDAISEARRAGIRVRMITGDHAVTASAIGEELGIDGAAISGSDLDEMSDATFSERVDGIGVIGRVAPEHKVRLVEILQERGAIVGMTGDGVNDAPALKAADIGIAMGITGTEVSKQASRMILADDNFATIIRAVKRGRAIYDNLEKYLRFQLTALLAYLLFFIVAAFSGLGDGAPLSPLQILFLNFAVAVPFALALGMDRESPGLMDRPPRDASASVLNRRALKMLALPAAATAAAGLLVIGLAPGDLISDNATVPGTMGVVTLALSFFVIAIESRSETLSVFQTGLDAPFIKRLSIGLGATVGVVVLDFLNNWFDTVPLSGREWGITIAAAGGVFLVIEAQKLVLRLGWVGRVSTAGVEGNLPTGASDAPEGSGGG